MKDKQLSFFQPNKNNIELPNDTKPISRYNGEVPCYKCLCNKCILNVNIYPNLTEVELETIKEKDSCWNCEDCYFYSMDNGNKNTIETGCNRFIKSNHYIEQEKRLIELEAKKRRYKFKILNSQD